MNEMKTFLELAAEYAPYHTLRAFHEGTEAYMDRNYDNPYGECGVAGQAWDRGLECASRYTRQHGRYDGWTAIEA